MKIDLDELERKARSATPGPWYTHEPGCDPFRPICGWGQFHEAEGPFGGFGATGPDVHSKEQALRDAAHISTFGNCARQPASSPRWRAPATGKTSMGAARSSLALGLSYSRSSRVTSRRSTTRSRAWAGR